jgi:hypothetical protein
LAFLLMKYVVSYESWVHDPKLSNPDFCKAPVKRS